MMAPILKDLELELLLELLELEDLESELLPQAARLNTIADANSSASNFFFIPVSSLKFCFHVFTYNRL
jgi:hypothetical protein